MGVLVHKDFEFIIQGITGREALNFTRECLDYGSNVVGGVTPGRGGRDVYGVPVYDTVREITSQRKVDGTVITVPLAFAPDVAKMTATFDKGVLRVKVMKPEEVAAKKVTVPITKAS